MTERVFADHFSTHAGAYSAARPQYPPALFAALAGVSRQRECAWDCATGSGQAAVALTKHFDRVIATDASASQLHHATRHRRVDYLVGVAERPSLAPNSVDLVTVAQALHWFDIETFFVACRRVLRPGGVLAYWCYGDAHITSDCNRIMREFFASLEAYWPPETAIVEARYASVTAPFPRESVGEFTMEAEWTVEEMLAYMSTWSACQRNRREIGADPLLRCADALRDAWGGGRRTVRWPLYLTVARAPG